MIRKLPKLLSIGTLSAVFLLLLLPSMMQSIPFASESGGYIVLRPSLPNGDNAGGIYPAKGGAFVEDESNGNLVFCGGQIRTS